MTILVIGGTGNAGSAVTAALATKNVEVRVLANKAAPSQKQPRVDYVTGDVSDMDFMRTTLRDISTVFILNPVVADEANRALLTLDLVEAAGIRRVVYFSMINADTFADVPHASAKFAAERAIERLRLPATILRPNYFFQNDLTQKMPLTTQQQYAMPIGSVGVEMVDTRDIAEIAAIELVRRETSPEPLPANLIEIVGPEVFTGQSIAQLWSEVLGEPITYAGDDLDAAEKNFGMQLPSAMAYDTALMFRGFHREGMLGSPGTAGRLAEMLGRPLRTYRAFAEEAAAGWRKPLLSKIADAVLPGRASR
jgi:uncharacterized protein YbjT (DUF2867 family)